MTSALRLATHLLGLIAFLAISSTSTANVNHIMKVKVLVDKLGIQKWMKQTGKPQRAFREELDASFVEVRNIFDSLKKYGLYIQPQIDSLTFLQYNFPPGEEPEKSDGRAILRNVKDLTAQTYSTNPTDVVLLLTGFTDRGPLGVTFKGVACSNDNSVVVQLSGTFITATAIAHELAHTLGVPHDGDEESARCAADGGYLMKAMGDFNPLNFLFSPCSPGAMKKFINQLNREGRNCLLDGKLKRNKGPGFGRMVSPDQLCERIVGRGAYVDRGIFAGQKEKCVYLPCTNGAKIDKAQIPNGFDCGVNKKCHQGKCVPARNSVRHEYCPFGSSYKASKGNFRSCNQVPISQCDMNMKSACCERCLNAQTAVMTPDMVCQVKFERDTRTKFYKEQTISMNFNMCEKIRCIFEIFTGQVDTPEEMQCGKNKVCRNKRCVNR